MSRGMYFDDALQYDQVVASQENLREEENSGCTEKPVYTEPLRFCKLVTKRPHLWFGAFLGVHTASVVVSLVLMFTGFDVFLVDFAGLPVALNNEPWLARELAFSGRFDYDGRIRHNLSPPKHAFQGKRSVISHHSLVLLYNAAKKDGFDGNVFTKARLEIMRRIEDTLVAAPGYKDMCQVSPLGPCVPPMSVLRFFDGTFVHEDPVFYDPHFNNISRVLYAAYSYNVTRGDFLHALGKSYVMTPDKVSVPVTRSVLPFGGTAPKLVAASTDFMLEKLNPILQGFLDIEQLDFTFYNENMMIEAAKAQCYKDMYLAIGSILFIFGFILFHTCSLWVTSLGVFGVVCSFAETNIIYRYVIGFRYFGFFHVLAMFIILGIGADDLFIFWDAWKASELRTFPTLAHRLDETFRKSSISMFVTSLTTVMAFAASALSPLLVTRSFGVFSAVLVTIDYISVITFFPTIVIVHHLHFEKKCLCLPCSRRMGGRRRSCCAGGDDGSHSGNVGGNCSGDAGGSRVGSGGNGSVLPNHQPVDESGAVTAEDLNAPAAGASQVEAPGENYSSSSSSSHYCSPQGVDLQLNATTVWYTHMSEQQQTAQSNDAPPTADMNPFYSGDVIEDEEGAVVDNGTTTAHPGGNLSHNCTVVTEHTSNGECAGGRGDSEGGIGEERGGGAKGKGRRPKRCGLVVFFADYYMRLVTHKVMRWVLLAVLLGVVVLFLFSATRIKPDNQQVALFKESHHYTRAFRLISHGFVQNDKETSILLWLVWGLKPRDMSACHFSDYTCEGEQVFDSSFNPSTEAAQRSFVSLCDKLYNLTDQEVHDFRIRYDMQTGRRQVSCFTRDVVKFLKRDPQFSHMDVSLPWEASKLRAAMAPLERFYDAKAVFNSSYPYFLDVPVNYFLLDGYRQRNTPYTEQYNNIIAEEKTDFSSFVVPAQSPQPMYVGNRIKFIAVRIATTLRYASLSYSEHLPVLDKWEQFMEEQLSMMPPELQGGFQVTLVGWHWIKIQKSLVDNAIVGVVLGVSLALPILIVCTYNVINGLLATLTICCVTVCVIGVVPLAGWKLGVLVSLNMCLVVGLAVDYVVHLAEGYHMARARDRTGRLKHALETMGISIFSGACTTLGASTFMLFAQIQFFYQFGIFMLSTIGFSLLFSMGLYVTTMGILGPENNTGDIRVPFRACFVRLKRCQMLGSRYSSNIGSSQSTQQLNLPHDMSTCSLRSYKSTVATIQTST